VGLVTAKVSPEGGRQLRDILAGEGGGAGGDRPGNQKIPQWGSMNKEEGRGTTREKNESSF